MSAQRHVAEAPLEVPVHDDLAALTGADLVFYGVDHSGPSYEARVFFNNPDADEDTPTEPGSGYAGSFTVFGHGGCYGDDPRHCDPEYGYRDAFDLRLPHPLTPFTKIVRVGDALKNLGKPEVTLTVVAVAPESAIGAGGERPMTFSEVRLLTYFD